MVRLADQCSKALSHLIGSEKYRPGDVLPSEITLAKSFGVSRTVIREAVSRLRFEGIVTSRRGKGIVVLAARSSAARTIPMPTLDDPASLLNLIEMREGMEADAAALAAERRQASDLEQMERSLAELAEALDTGDTRTGVAADLRFHQAIYAATGNPYYPHVLQTVTEQMFECLEICRTLYATRWSGGRTGHAEHEKLFQAIRSADVEGARASARDHIHNTGQRVRKTLF